MSLECGECEADIRGGHLLGCGAPRRHRQRRALHAAGRGTLTGRFSPGVPGVCGPFEELEAGTFSRIDVKVHDARTIRGLLKRHLLRRGVDLTAYVTRITLTAKGRMELLR